MISVAIVAVIYEEPEYAATREAIARTGAPVQWVDRKGVGSLAEAYNRGFRKAFAWAPAFIWFVSNPRFAAGTLTRLGEHLSARPDLAALQPTYPSDHLRLRPDGSGLVKEVAFVEFTCPLVRTAVFAEHPLDEAMPYDGHDLDWGHRVRAAGWQLGADHGVQVEHEYIRHAKKRKPHLVTLRRARLREKARPATMAALEDRYGPGYAELLGWQR